MLQRVWQQIDQYDKIIIHRHVSPDPDAFGSQLALAEIIKENYPYKLVRTVGYSEPTMAWMGVMDTDVEECDYEGALVIVTDTANAPRIDDNRYRLAHCLIKIDHHPETDDYGDYRLVETASSSTCEIIVELFKVNQERYNLKMPAKAAELLYTGIIADSGRFMYDTTTKRTYENAAALVDYAFSRDMVHKNLYTRSLNIVQAQGFVLSHFKVTDSGVGYIKMTTEQLESFGLTTATRAALVNTMANIEGVHVWVCFFEHDERVRANIRSNGPIINTVAAQFDGGGHPKASGAWAKTWEECEDILDGLDQACQQYFQELNQ